MAGGYRNGSGRSKSGYYRGIYCGSTYELCWVIYHLDHNIEFTRFPGKLSSDDLTYYPDFLLGDNNTIIETKGYESQDSVNRKNELAEYFGYIVKVLRKDDLKFAFDYVISVYRTNKFYELYDGYKPKYEQVCDYCKTSFLTDRKIKTETKFCNRSCAGRFRAMNLQTQGMSREVRTKISLALLGKKPKSYTRKYKQFWITDGVKNTRIKAGDTIPPGYQKGRTLSL